MNQHLYYYPTTFMTVSPSMMLQMMTFSSLRSSTDYYNLLSTYNPYQTYPSTHLLIRYILARPYTISPPCRITPMPTTSSVWLVILMCVSYTL
jgi:hypothetical protein